MVKATSLEEKKTKDYKIVDFLSSLDISRLGLLNTAQTAPVVPKRSWEQYLREAFSDFSKRTEQFVDKYAFHLGATEIDLCEQLANHSFVSHLNNGFIAQRIASEEGFCQFRYPFLQIATMDHGGNSMLADFIINLKCLAVIVEESLDGKNLTHRQNWQENVAPHVGSGIDAQQSAAADRLKPAAAELGR
jgi:hypothetical protein